MTRLAELVPMTQIGGTASNLSEASADGSTFPAKWSTQEQANEFEGRTAVHRAVVADEWSVLRRGIRAVLLECGVTAVTATGTTSEAVEEAETRDAELVVLGVTPDMGTRESVTHARAHLPKARIIVLEPEPERGSLLDLLGYGADALLTRTPDDEELRDAVTRVGKGERFVSPGLLGAVFGDNGLDPEEQAPAGILSDRQRFILRLAAEGRSNKQIASELFIGEATVKTHLQKIYEKLGVSNRVQAVGRALELRALY